MFEDHIDRPATTALALNDMFNRNLRTGEPRDELVERSNIIPNAVLLVAAMRRLRIPIYWIRVVEREDGADVPKTVVDYHPRGRSTPWPPLVATDPAGYNIEELPIEPNDDVVVKPRLDPFIGTDLDVKLRARGVQTLLLGGYATNGGVESGARTGSCLGYNVIVVSDCSYNVEEDLHKLALTRILPAFGRVRTTEETIALLEGSGHRGHDNSSARPRRAGIDDSSA